MALDELTDTQLIDKVLKCNQDAFEVLFNRYREPIRQFHLARTQGNVEDSEDLLQDTFVKVYLKIHTFDIRYSFGQWIYAIAKNTFVDYYRKKRDDVSDLSVSDSTISQLPTPEESIINTQQRAQIDQYLKVMDDKYSRLVELRFIKEYSYEEIANELDLPLGTVKTQIFRAKDILCKHLKLQ